jgi:two-component system, NtrC family, nitrogen regulation sensor histidine kinase GlnL
MSSNAYAGLDWISTATVALTPSLRIQAVNSAAETLFQHSRRHLVGMRLEELLLPNSPLLAAIEKALAHRTSYTEQEIEVRTGPTAHVVTRCTVNVIDSADLALMLEIRPIDEQLKVERDERTQAQLRANRELIRNLAHEIKNPLGGVRGAAQLLARELNTLKLSPHLQEYTQVIVAETDRLQNLLNRLLTPARPLLPAETNIHEVLTHILTLIDAEFNGLHETIALKKDFDVSLPPIFGDREQLTQAIINVVRNAAQILTQEKTANATIAISTRIARNVMVGRMRHRLAVRVRVSDNGPGIPPEMIDTIFHPLVSHREGGTGLGLTIAQTFISQHEGLIEVISEPGATHFDITLPLQRGTAP